MKKSHILLGFVAFALLCIIFNFGEISNYYMSNESLYDSVTNFDLLQSNYDSSFKFESIFSSRSLSNEQVATDNNLHKRKKKLNLKNENSTDFDLSKTKKRRNNMTRSDDLLGHKLKKVSSLRNNSQVESTNLSSWLPIHEDLHNLNYSGPFFYMYDLPKQYWWRWPLNTSDCIESGYVTHDHAMLSGLGKPLNIKNGLFLTWHFSLFSSLYNRLKRSKRRTFNPEKASMFIIPYDLSLDGYVNPDNCRNRGSCSKNYVFELEEFLKSSKYFQRYQGGDHVVLWSLGHYHPWPRANCDTFMKKFCLRCSFTCYWMDPTIKNNNFVSVPFPSAYHWWDGIENIPWKYHNTTNTTTEYSRNLTVVYLGSTKTLNPSHTKIRRAMTTQCNTSTECHWLQIGHSSIDQNIGEFLSIYKRSVFCLCPPGDDPARKAVFDAILSGCIPVIFEVATLFNQYPWHLGEKKALEIAVNIPGNKVRTGEIQFMNYLLNITQDVIEKKQRAIELLAPTLQYSIPPLNNMEDIYDQTPWDPPFPDGVDVTLDGLFHRTNKVIHMESTLIPPIVMKTSEWSKKYDKVIIETPPPPPPTPLSPPP